MFPFAAHFFYIMLLAKKSEASSLALLFFFISFAGWCGETLLFLIRFGQLRDRGFLTLPFCTIYGSSVLGVGLLLGTPEGGRFAPLFRRASRLRPFPRAAARTCLWLLYALSAGLLPTLAELAFGGVFLLCGLRLWDYSYKKIHLFGLISPDQSLLWGVLLPLARRFAWEPMLAAAGRIPPRARRSAAIFLSALLMLDFACNVLFLLCTGRRLTLF